MAQSREICCCGADSWTKVIAWIEIVVSTLSIFFLVILFSIILNVGVDTLIKSLAGPQVSAEDKRTFFAVIIGVMAYCFVASVLTLMMANFLLKGATQRNPKYVMAWIIYTIICLAINFVGHLLILNIVGLILELAITGFFLWVVLVFKRELDAEKIGTSGGVVYKA